MVEVPLDASGMQVVLVVDDEPDITSAVHALLSHSLAVRVLEARSGEEALRTLRATDVDLILSDHFMPGMTGFELLRRSVAVAPDVPRAMMTAAADLNLAVEAINDLGVVAFYPKPFDSQKLVDGVRAILARRRASLLRDSGFRQASRVFQRETALSGQKARSAPFVGSLLPPTRDREKA